MVAVVVAAVMHLQALGVALMVQEVWSLDWVCRRVIRPQPGVKVGYWRRWERKRESFDGYGCVWMLDLG